MPIPTYATVISQIDAYIIANGNNEITANVLNPILKVITDFANNTIGNLDTLTTSDNTNVVNAINSLKIAFDNLNNNGVQLRTGYADPNITPPPVYNYADFYMELDISDDSPIQLWQWNGAEWTTYSSVYSKAEIDFLLENAIDHNNLLNKGTNTHAQIDTHIANTSNPHNVTKAQVGLSNVDNTSDLNKPISTATQTALDNKADLVGGFVPSSQLPSYVDDVIEVADFASLPLTGETGKIYITLDDNKNYRWSGSVYVNMTDSTIPNLQAVTDVGNVTTNTLFANTVSDIAIKGYSTDNFGGDFYSLNNDGLNVVSVNRRAGVFSINSGSTEDIIVGINGISELFKVKSNGDIKIRGILDNTDSIGTSGQILSSTGTGVDWIDASGILGTTNLSYTASPTNGLVLSDTGTDATIPLATGTDAGLLQPSHFSVLNNGVWGLTGNAGTNPATNFIGTNDAQPLVFRVNNIKSGLISHVSLSNLLFGYDSGNLITTGTANTSLGYEALKNLTTGVNNTAIGYQSMINANSGGNTALGCFTLNFLTTGSSNNALGLQAQWLCTTGNQNVAVGNGALYTNSTSSGNTGLGHNALLLATNSFNTAVGSIAGNTITTGQGNIAIGYQSSNGLTTGSFNIAIGYQVSLPSNTASNQINIGNFWYKLGGANLSGVNTTAPTKAWDINGELRIRTLPTGLSTENILVVNGSGDVRSISPTAYTRNLYDIDGTLTGNRIVTQGTNTLSFTSNVVNGFSVDGTTFSVDSLNNRVGIGTTAPAYKLDVVGEVRSINSNAFRATAGGYSVMLRNDGSDFYILQTNAADPDGFWNTFRPFRLNLTTGDVSLNSVFARQSDGKVGIGTTSPTALLDINSNLLRLRTTKTPASATDTGNAGDICWDTNYVYVCTANNTWKRTAIATW